MNRGARHLELDRLFDAGSADRQLRRGRRGPAQFFDCLILFPTFGRPAVQHDDAVARLNAGALGRRIGQRRDDGDPAIAHLDLDAEAGVITGRRFRELPEIVRFEKDGIGIAELIQHAVDRHLVESLLVERVDVIIRDVCQHVVEQAGLLVDRPGRFGFALQEPTTADQGGEKDGGNHEPFMSNHHAPLSDRAVAAATSRQAMSWTAFLG